MWQYQNTDELYHHGILGMRWGIRRYQNADGSYTNEDKKRYINDKTKHITSESKRIEAAKKYAKKWNNNKNVKNYKQSSKDFKIADKLRNKKLSQLTNQELKTLNNRQQLEYNYKLNNPSKIKKGMAIVAGVAGGIGTITKLYNNSKKIKTLVPKGKEAAQKAIISLALIGKLNKKI